MKKIFFLGFITILMSSCGASKKTSTSKKKTNVEKQNTETKDTNNNNVNNTDNNPKSEDLNITALKYIAKYKNIAKKEMKNYGIPASITLAQGLLESQNGNSELATQANNHFGIKCHKKWKGEVYLHDDDKTQECFRKYLNPEESYKDHSKFLAGRKRYAFLFSLPKTDYESWALGLKKAGYATDPSYPQKLMYIIKKYDLSKLDKEVPEAMSVKVDESNENTDRRQQKFVHEVKKGETLFTISQEYNIAVKDIQRINNLNDFDIYEGQLLVLVKSNKKNIPKQIVSPKVADPVKTDTTVIPVETPSGDSNDNGIFELYMVKKGETLFSIANSKHIDIEDLKNANNLFNNEISVGDNLKIPLDKVIKQDKKVETPVVTETPEPTVDENKYHIVQPGETLYRIHVNYGVSIDKLRKLNHLRGNYIKVGQKLRIK